MLDLINSGVPTNYALKFEIDPSKETVKGTAAISFSKTNNFDDFNLVLHCVDITIADARIDNHELKTKFSENTVAFVSQSSINLADTFVLHFSFTSKMHHIKTFKDPTHGIFKTNFMNEETGAADSMIVATHAQPSFCRQIFPCVDEQTKATYDVTIVTATKYTVLANSALKERSVSDENQVCVFETTPLMTSSLFGFVVGDLDVIQSDSVRFFAPNSATPMTYALDVATKCLPVLKDVFGTDLAIGKVDFVALPFLSDGAMENFGLVTVQQGHVMLSRDNYVQIGQLVAHELVHQWMGNYVSFQWDALWFNEAFATWFADFILEKAGFPVEDRTSQLEKTLLRDDSAPSVTSTGKKMPESTHDALDAHSYSKGIYLLRQLANFLSGNNDKYDAFVEKLKELFASDTMHLSAIKLASIWKHFGQEDLMNSWLNQAGHPVVTVSKTGSTYSVEQSGDFIVPLFDSANTLLTAPITMDAVEPINKNNSGFYRVKYTDLDMYKVLAKKCSAREIAKVAHDVQYFIAKEFDPVYIPATFILVEKFTEQKLVDGDYHALSVLLETIELIAASKRSHLAKDEFHTWEKEFLHPLVQRVSKRVNWNSGTVSEHYTASLVSLLTLGLKTPQMQSKADTIYRAQNPYEVVPAAMQCVCYHGNTKTWKKMYNLALEGNTAALEAIGFVQDGELRKQVYDLIMRDDLELPLENCLIGFEHAPRDEVWEWFVAQYDTLAQRSRNRATPKHAKQIVSSIVTIIFNMFVKDSRIEPFIESKIKTQSGNGLRDIYNSILENHKLGEKIAHL